MRKTVMAIAMAAFVLAACGGGDKATPPTTAAPRAAAPMTDAEKAELAFLQEMVPHHVQAVEMARLCPDRAQRDQLKTLCSAIVTTQSKEIAEMKAWAVRYYATQLEEKPAGAGHGEGHRPGMGGMQSDDDVMALGRMKGDAFDRRFVEMMTGHHKGAIESATKIKDMAPHAEVKSLAANIIASQNAEIAQMSGLLQTS